MAMVNWLRRETPTGRVADESEIHQHSGWLIPLILAVVVVVLCAALLLYYMRPFALSRNAAPFRDNRASFVAIPVNLAGMALSIPRRYIEPGVARKNMVALVAAVETPVHGTRVVGVPEIRSAELNLVSEPVRKTA